ncbi:hypothetical protein CHS0354_039559 [Potamilus streckersoni]|uniref:Uncharacterized protein n=1 Tax=Potamilus streckersoni TaxID=2493646 RepID=A0AAE0W1Y3_9BIVA|nr:hypothetical protein CHS0354_039559 [Potamilus streckersoni]
MRSIKIEASTVKKHAEEQGEIGEMLSAAWKGLCKLFVRLEIKRQRDNPSKFQSLEIESENITVAVIQDVAAPSEHLLKGRPWTEEEKAAAMKQYGYQILRNTLPKKNKLKIV